MTTNLVGSQTSTTLTTLSTSATSATTVTNTATITPATVALNSSPSALTNALDFISDITLSVSTPAGTTPTVSELVNASNAEYSTSGTPAGMKPFEVNGTQLSITDNTTGLAAKVWITSQNQLIIAYQGTTGGSNIFSNPAIAFAQIGTDVGIYEQTTPTAETEALTFAKTVLSYAAGVGISAANVFVTGHSLGGIEAEYVAQQTGLGGLALEPTGLPSAPAAGATGQNFVDVVTYGDPVGNYSSDIQGEQPFAPATGLAHYGQIVMVGNPANQTTLATDVSTWGKSLGDDASTLLNLAGLLFDYHLPSVQAYNLGVTLNQNNLADGIGNLSGPILNAGSLSISQFIAADANNAPASASAAKIA